jgi:cytochrome P450
MSAAPTAATLPPGPRLPRLVQTAAFMFFPRRFFDLCRRRYGDAVTFGTLFDSRFVMLFDPELVKELFKGPPEQLRAGEANAPLGPIVGSRSVLLLDGAEHIRHRRLMLPPFHGQRMTAYESAMREAADRAIDEWPVGEPFALLPSMQGLTLEVIMRAVFGLEPGPLDDELRRRLRAMLDPIASSTLSLLVLMATAARRGDEAAMSRFDAQRRAVDEILYEEIARRRAEPDLESRDDVFSMLVVARDEDGGALTDSEVRDELVTLLVAGHETTSVGLAWTFDLLLHNPRVLERAREGDDDYLDAVIKESLRLRPVIAGVGRVVRGEPFALNGYSIPPGVEINPSITTIHRRPDRYPAPEEFRPERFLGDDAPDTYTWVPFGGGTRRCLGASFALMEMKVVVRRVLERTELRAASRAPEKAHRRGVTLAPKHGVRVVRTR